MDDIKPKLDQTGNLLITLIESLGIRDKWKVFDTRDNLRSFLSVSKEDLGVNFAVVFHQKGTADSVLFAQSISMKKIHPGDLASFHVEIDFLNIGHEFIEKALDEIKTFFSKYVKITNYTFLNIRIGHTDYPKPVFIAVEGSRDEVNAQLQLGYQKPNFVLKGFDSCNDIKSMFERQIFLSSTIPYMIDFVGNGTTETYPE